MKKGKRRPGNEPLAGIRYKFHKGKYFKENNKIFLRIIVGKDILKANKWKKGTLIKVDFDKKNPLKMVLSKANKTERPFYTMQKEAEAQAGWIKFTWKNGKVPAATFKKVGTTAARVKERKAGLQVELVNLA